jgi:hypothetical protein
MTERRTAVEVGPRYNGGIRLDQGASFIMLDRDEALQLVADIQRLIQARPMAETRIGRT